MSTDRAQRQRREIKYIISEERALEIRSYLSSYLEPDEFAAGKPDNSYAVHTLYLDSNQLVTYHAANNGDRNRFKLRIRYYDDNPSSPVCFEIKRRINEGIVKQRARVKRDAVNSLLAGESPRPGHLSSWHPQQWTDLLDFWQLVERLQAAPRAHNAYMREAYLNAPEDTVRVTIDRFVRMGPEFSWQLGTDMPDAIEVFSGLVILELKFTDRMPTWLIEMVRGFELKSSGAAKYVQGVEQLGEQRVARRLTGFEWGNAVVSTATSAPWLDASAAVRGALGPNRQ
ncbi:VTC domain-containing protein [Horticoccus sp. 23ND18S-11]|uniref:VTC domain-containing protein n=1 Tax=Horticoccus sp. 23ND18S-11 TaxID=3391832 RepID=UPI0039C9B723